MKSRSFGKYLIYLIFSIPYIMILIPISNSFSSVFTISSIVFGYTMISSIYKEEEYVE